MPKKLELRGDKQRKTTLKKQGRKPKARTLLDSVNELRDSMDAQLAEVAAVYGTDSQATRSVGRRQALQEGTPHGPGRSAASNPMDGPQHHKIQRMPGDMEASRNLANLILGLQGQCTIQSQRMMGPMYQDSRGGQQPLNLPRAAMGDPGTPSGVSTPFARTQRFAPQPSGGGKGGM